MSWVTVIWSAVASAGLTLGAVHFLVWVRRPAASAHLLFFLTCVGTAAFAVCELWMMRATTPDEAGLALRWAHLPVWVLVLSLVGFVRRYLHAGRPWLGWAVCGVRTLSLMLNFLLAPNLNYRSIDSLRPIPLLGESVSTVVGVPSPWMLVGQASLVLLVIFAVDAAVEVWRRGDRRKALLVGGSIVLFALGGTIQSALVLWGVVAAPIAASLFYQGLVAAMGYELSLDVIRAARLSDELHEEQERIRLAATAAKLTLWTWDVPRNRIWVTPEGRGFAGAPQGVITLEQFLATVQAEDREPVRAAVQQALRGAEYRAEYRVALAGGAIRWVTARGKVEFDRRGQPSRLRGVTLDITDRKLAEREAQLQRAETAHLARVTTVGEISASLAHELNQPLAAILSNTRAAELHLQRGQPDLGELRAILADIRSEDLRASDIIQRIRAFLKRSAPERQPLDVARLVEDTVRLVSGEAADRQSDVRAEVSPGLPPVAGDRVHLQQILVNLLINGLDAMSSCPPQSRTLAIRAGPLHPNLIEIAVSDTGPGIAPESLARAFEPFYTTKQDGLGLGLAISRSIAEAHGGSIVLESDPGRGTTVRVRLPRYEG